LQLGDEVGVEAIAEKIAGALLEDRKEQGAIDEGYGGGAAGVSA